MNKALPYIAVVLIGFFVFSFLTAINRHDRERDFSLISEQRVITADWKKAIVGTLNSKALVCLRYFAYKDKHRGAAISTLESACTNVAIDYLKSQNKEGILK